MLFVIVEKVENKNYFSIINIFPLENCPFQPYYGGENIFGKEIFCFRKGVD